MKFKYTEKELYDIVNLSNANAETANLAAELLRVQTLKTNYVERGYVINKLQTDLFKARKSKATYKRQVEVLTRTLTGESYMEDPDLLDEVTTATNELAAETGDKSYFASTESLMKKNNARKEYVSKGTKLAAVS